MCSWLNPVEIACRLESVRTNSPAATTSSSEIAICETTSTRLRPARHQRRRPPADGSPPRVCFNAGVRSTREVCSAGASPNSSPVPSAAAMVTANTCQFRFAFNTKFSCPFASNTDSDGDSPLADQDPEQAADHGQQQALGEKLADHARASGSQAEPHRHLAPSPCRARQQQVRDVGAGDRQNQPHHGHQHVERLRIAPAQKVHAAGGFLQVELGKIGALLVVRRGGGDEVLEGWFQRGLRPRQRDAGAKPSDHLDPIAVLVEIASVRVEAGPSRQRDARPHRQIQIDRAPGYMPKNSGADTPTMVYGTLFSSTGWPTALETSPKRRAA